MVGVVARRLAKAFKQFPGRKTYTNLHCLGCDSSKVVSAMDQSPIQTCVLKMNIKCENCQKRVKKKLQKIHGVHSINIDANEGKVVVSSTVDPRLFIAMFAREGKKAELLSESAAKPQAMMNNHDEAEHQGKKMQNSTPKAKDIAANLMDRDINTKSQLAQSEEFAKIPGLKQVEINQSRNIKMTFRDSDDLGCISGEDDNHNYRVVNINEDDHMQGHRLPEVQEQNGDSADEPAKSTQPEPPQPPAPPSPTLPLKGPCGSSGGGDVGSSVHCCHDRPQVKFACSGGAPPGMKYMEQPIRPASYYAPPPPHYLHPFAPPPSYYAHWGPPPPPPSAAHPPPYDVYFGEDNRDCSMM